MRVSLKPLVLIFALFIFFHSLAQIPNAKKEAGSLDEGVKIESYTQYDFVPGDKILYYEDFSQDAIGDFPALWTTNGSGEVKTLNIAPGKWLHMNAEGTYSFTKEIDFPSNFIMEFDIIPNEEYNEYELTFYNEEGNMELNTDLYPGTHGLHIKPNTEDGSGWLTLGYSIDSDDWLEGKSAKNPIVAGTLNHAIIWIQNRRIRIYHRGEKVLDMPTNIYAGTRFNRFRFSGYNEEDKPYISNIKITTASPDTRSKLITEGKLVSYGIYFDSGKDVVKPESYGSVKEIAKVLSDVPDVRILIVGHTDGDGDDALNLDLSKRRAASVKNFLASGFWIDASRIETNGKGESEPIEPNTTSEGKAKNRRVEFLKL